MSQLECIKKSINPNMIYYDLTIKNFQSTSDEGQHLVFNESRSSNYLPCSGDYYLSIIRFEIDTYALPTYIASIQPNQPDPNIMIYSVTLEYDFDDEKVTNQQFLIWNPTVKNATVPPPPSATSNGMQINSNYYYGYSYKHFIDLINDALTRAMTAIKFEAEGLADVDAPFMVWKPEQNIAHLYADEDTFNTNDGKVKIYFNRSLYGLFTSFPANRNSFSSPDGKVYQIIVDDNKKVDITIDPLINAGKQTVIVKQEHSTIANWSAVSSIVFTSATLPVVANQLSEPIVFNNGQRISSSSSDNFANIITDFATNEQNYKPNLIYVPSSEYRRIDLLGNQALTNLDVSVFWKDRYGRLNEFLLMSGASCSLKILFEKKNRN